MKKFKDAFNGIFVAFKSQQNIKIHFFISIIVFGMGIFFQLKTFEWSLILLCIGLVMAAEIFNTAIEKLCDFVEPHHHKKIGIIKDFSAGAVLVLAIISAIIGIVIFLPKIINVFWS